MEDRESLKKDLERVDLSLVFLLLIILSILLSYQAARAQRGQLRFLLSGGEAGCCPSLFPIRYAASVIVVGALCFFLCLAVETQEEAQASGDSAEQRSAQTNSLASTLVLAAALLRLRDLVFVENSRQAALLEAEDLPAGI